MSKILLSACLRGAVDTAAAVLLLIWIRSGDDLYFEFNKDGWEIEICTEGNGLF